MQKLIGTAIVLMRFVWIFGLSEAQQVQMPVNYLPKEYFLPDGTRDPRHLGSSPGTFYSSNPPGNGIVTTTTYHLNPRLHPLGFNQNNNNINNNNINNNNPGGLANSINYNNYRYGTPTLHSINPNLPSNNLIHNNQYGEKIVGSSSTINSAKRAAPRRLKLRRLPKSFRPPKEFIIYSLPEQSFWSTDELGTTPTDPANNSLDIDGTPADDQELIDIVDEDDLNNNGTDKGTSPTLNPASLSKLTKGQRKSLLGQCMKQCIDVLL